jgi:protein SCO1/2
MLTVLARAALLWLASAATGLAATAGGETDHMHHHAAVRPQMQRSSGDYALPPVWLVRSDGQRVRFPDDIDGGKPVILNFIYTSCTTICPLMTQSFAELQDKLGPERDRTLMVSVSIDPEQDTPKRLREYAQRYKAGPQWVFYTGSEEASVAVQKAFAVYRADKMNHTPVTLMRSAPGRPWLRIDGLATPGELLEEYRRWTGR